MDEIELRLAALETLIMERLSLDGPGHFAQLEAQLREGLPTPGEPGYGGEEYTIRMGALGILEDAKRRFDLFTDGIRIPKTPD